MNEKAKKLTIEEWRQLGYHYDLDDKLKKWIITGSPFGIKTFCNQLKIYAANTKNKSKSEHEHWGPYSFLKIMTWDQAGINEESIFGSIDDINRLANLIDKKVDDSLINDIVNIKKEYTPNSDYSIEFRIKEYGYDPSKSDTQLWK